MTPHWRAAQLKLRLTALLLACIGLWMSSGATLRHTDDLSQYRSFAAGRTLLGHTHSAPQADQCVAHEWMNAWQTLHTALVRVAQATLPVAALRQRLVLSLHLSGFDYVSGRAPPSRIS